MIPPDARSGLFAPTGPQADAADTGWGAPDAHDPQADPQSARLALKKTLERKRHNDAARKLEFDELRRLRHAESATRRADTEKTAPSLFSSDMSELSDMDDRATTLKKINDIESEMSEQWWHGRTASGVARTSAPRPESPPPADPADTVMPTMPPTQGLDSLPLDEVMTTQQDRLASGETAPMGLLMPAAAQQTSALDVGHGSAFAASRLRAQERSARAADPVLEEAAIRFANHDDAGAASVLLQALQDSKAKPEALALWAAALLDLYRSTGQRPAFEALAQSMAARLGRAAPVWPQHSAPPAADDFADTVVLAPDTGAAAQPTALSGQLLGDCEALLARFQVPDKASLPVSCRDLIRVDQTAAGCLLHWAAHVESAGSRVVLHDVAPLLAAFFQVIGISEHAQVHTRQD